ncbi:MAG: DNA-binding response regulator [SAR202 cluster bacterium Casp-Chloro-G4]|nr:response regulator transcription factor [Chloroflexota bacterium]MDA1227664.1 response regulator transcription factor [Chloroflexota bacterium]PKB61893.1 MAG: DNA-binding response regulator [SAR202 cluster bacterium Casp-Chloro-G4]
MSDATVLVVEDEENILEALRYSLEREGHTVYTAVDGEEGLNLARRIDPDLVILDVMLPKMDGFEICRILRGETDVPIIMLTARGEEIDRIVGLELGADDYVTKPFSTREFMVRVRNMLRRARLSDNVESSSAGEENLVAGNLEVDLTSHVVRLDGVAVDMKPREFDLLALLVKNSGRAYSRDQILQQLWGHDYYGDTRTVDVHVHWLREKIEPQPSKPQRLVTIRGVGYRFDR